MYWSPARSSLERHKRMTSLVTWGSLTLLCLGLVVWGANRMLFHPIKFPAGEWSMQKVLGAKDVSLRSADGTKLHAWWIDAPFESGQGSENRYPTSAWQCREHYASGFVGSEHRRGRVVGAVARLSRVRKERWQAIRARLLSGRGSGL